MTGHIYSWNSSPTCGSGGAMLVGSRRLTVGISSVAALMGPILSLYGCFPKCRDDLPPSGSIRRLMRPLRRLLSYWRLKKFARTISRESGRLRSRSVTSRFLGKFHRPERNSIVTQLQHRNWQEAFKSYSFLYCFCTKFWNNVWNEIQPFLFCKNFYKFLHHSSLEIERKCYPCLK